MGLLLFYFSHETLNVSEHFSVASDTHEGEASRSGNLFISLVSFLPGV
jgi:hypothetical protein